MRRAAAGLVVGRFALTFRRFALTLGGYALTAASCGGEPTPAPDPGVDASETLPISVPAPEVENGFLIVSPERVREWQTGSDPFVLIDARDPVQFSREHLPDAINVPYVDIRPGARLPDRDDRIVVYCSDAECPISQYAYEALTRLGYTEVYDMREGLQGWKDEGYPTVIEDDATDESAP
ncbi:MAG TPA: rhodanese-like domain-containing protein [Gemmatimonadota bacterium]|nr:rhodanese-like domain-containing protein [Gemmatimonadota bacterium]